MFTKDKYIEFINSKSFDIHELFILKNAISWELLGRHLDPVIQLNGGIPLPQNTRLTLESYGLITTLLGDKIRYIGHTTESFVWEINGIRFK